MIPDLGQAFSFDAFRRGEPSQKTYTSLNVNGEMLRIDSSTSSGRNAGGAARCGQAGRSQRRQLIPIGVAASALKSSCLAYTRRLANLISQPSPMAKRGSIAPQGVSERRTGRAIEHHCEPSVSSKTCVKIRPGSANVA